MCRDDTWRTYLSARAEQIAQLADEIARRSTANSSPGSIVNRRDPTLLGHLDVWEAVHAGDTEDDALSGREQLYERHLYERRQAISTCPYASPRRWLPLVTAIDPVAAAAPEYPRLAAALTDAFDARMDVDRLLPRLLAEHRDDYAAAVDELRARADKAESRLREALHGRELEHARVRQLHTPYRTPNVDPPGYGISR
jgi:hypothetical protein